MSVDTVTVGSGRGTTRLRRVASGRTLRDRRLPDGVRSTSAASGRFGADAGRGARCDSVGVGSGAARCSPRSRPFCGAVTLAAGQVGFVMPTDGERIDGARGWSRRVAIAGSFRGMRSVSSSAFPPSSTARPTPMLQQVAARHRAGGECCSSATPTVRCDHHDRAILHPSSEAVGRDRHGARRDGDPGRIGLGSRHHRDPRTG
jgi:hypothetical protein